MVNPARNNCRLLGSVEQPSACLKSFVGRILVLLSPQDGTTIGSFMEYKGLSTRPVSSSGWANKDVHDALFMTKSPSFRQMLRNHPTMHVLSNSSQSVNEPIMKRGCQPQSTVPAPIRQRHKTQRGRCSGLPRSQHHSRSSWKKKLQTQNRLSQRDLTMQTLPSELCRRWRC